MAPFVALLLSATGLLTKAESTAYVQFPEDGWPDYKVGGHPHWVEESYDHHIVFEDEQRYNCHIGVSTWKTSWSHTKQAWCCMRDQQFCGSMHLPFDCTRDSDWKVWPAAKQKWCCRNFATACTSEQKYDCDAGVWNWQAAWSSNKKAFCCQHFQRGCSVSMEHLCDGHEEEWDACEDQPRCNACTPVDCLFTAWTKWYEEADCIGLEIRHRSIEVHNNECGLPCFGTKTESKPLPELHPKCLKMKQDCIFSTWSQWSVCQNQVDQAVRSRQIDKESLNGGVACKGSTKETRPCGGPEAKPCILSDWHDWTACSSSCGEGYQSRQRRVASEDYLSGQTCEDALLDTRSCNDAPCSTRDGQISHWSEWSPCTGASLQKTRRREVLASPQGVGMGFNVSLVEAGKCSPPDGEDCIISEWSSWSSCDKSCHGGQSFRHRRIIHFNINGGQGPIASLKEVKACNTLPCNGETKNCQWQAWQPWGSCSHQQGAGLALRKRDFIAATGDGEACSGSTSELKACIIEPEEVINCAWGEWLTWSTCSATCGGGTKQRSRSVTAAPNAKGKACDPLDKEVVEPCNTHLCGDCKDGLWGEWAAWGPCSAECGQAIQVRNRSVARQPNACGKSPVGLSEEFKLCKLPLCSEDRDCRLSLWSQWSECNNECHGLRQRVRKVAALSHGSGKPCDDESLTEVSDCNPIFGEAAPAACGPLKEKKDCLLEDWSAWGPCSVTCGDGQQLRKRSVVQPSANGGKLCSGNLTIVRGCKLPACPVEVAKDCAWGEWSNWGECTQCSGQRTRHRVIEQLPTMGGRLCDAKEAMEIANCSSTCHETRICAWAQWSNQECSECSRTSTRHRSLKLSTEGIFGAGSLLFKGTTLSSCIGTQLDEAVCEMPDKCKDVCEPKDCEFAAWGEWGAASCSGLCERQRVISELNNQCGSPCTGSLHETKRCDSPCHPPVDCAFSEWAEWSACSNATGYVTGQSHRQRVVQTSPKNGGLACYGDLGQTRACRGDHLGLADCELSSWESWSECSTSCGEGYQTRHRGIQRMAEAGGAQCNGMLSEVSGCHAGYWEDCGLGTEEHCVLAPWEEWSSCSITMTRERVRHFKQQARLGGLPCHSPMHEIQTCRASAAVDCVVSDWTQWDDCDATCGAAQARRQRQVVRFPSLHGKKCPTDLAQMKACSVPNCDVKDCQVSGWLSWSDCSTSCGQGHQSRLRSVINLREPGGYGCFFSIAENKVCHASTECSQDCTWHDWEEWQACSQSCGGGVKTRKRKLMLPENGGKHCAEKDMQEVRACNVGTCHGTCVNGLWASWVDWAPCSASCGGGVTFRTREVKRMANSCGHPALGKDKETKFCNVDVHCGADKDCLYTGWSSWNACSATTCSGIRDRRRNIASYGHGGGLFCQGALQEVEHCGTEQCGEGPAVDCEMETWGQWSACSASCDGGEMRRSRKITKHREHGGKTCQGPLEEARECAREHCGGGQAIDCVYGEWKEWAACLRCSGERKRFRHILVYPAEGGRACAPADLEEIGSCPNPCAEEKYCTWQTWSSWGACSMTCGPGGKRKRSRGMTEAVRPETKAKALQQKYRALYARTQHLENGQVKEVLFAFAAGFLTLFFVGGLARRVRPASRQDFDTEAQVSDSERPFLASL